MSQEEASQQYSPPPGGTPTPGDSSGEVETLEESSGAESVSRAKPARGRQARKTRKRKAEPPETEDAQEPDSSAPAPIFKRGKRDPAWLVMTLARNVILRM